MKKILLLAVEGDIPLLIYEKAKKEGEVLVLSSLLFSLPEGLKPDLWIDGISLTQILKVIREKKITHLCLAGKIPKNLVFEEERFQVEFKKLFSVPK